MNCVSHVHAHADLIQDAQLIVPSNSSMCPIQTISSGYCFSLLAGRLSVRIWWRILKDQRVPLQILHSFRHKHYVFSVHIFEQRTVITPERQFIAALRDLFDDERLRSWLLPRSPPPSRADAGVSIHDVHSFDYFPVSAEAICQSSPFRG